MLLLLLMRFPRQEHWSELPFPFPGDLTDPGIELTSPALAGGFFTTEPSGKPIYISTYIYMCVCIRIHIHPLGSVSKESPNTELLAKSLISFVL